MNENKTNINWFPGHMAKTRNQISKELKNIDIVYELIDARIPKSSRIEDIDSLIGNKKHILIITKKDLADPILLTKWQQYYASQNLNVIIANLQNDSDIKKIINLTHELMQNDQVKREEKGLKAKEIRVLVMGIPNVGKSTLINKIVGKKVANIGNKPGITHNLATLKTNHNITLIDTPGILWPKIKDKETALNLASFFAIKMEILDVNDVAVHILKKLAKYYPNKLLERYNLAISNQELNFEEIYLSIARKIGALKNNEVDYERVSNRLINDLKDEYIKGIVFDNEM